MINSHQPRVKVLWPQECIDSILAKRAYAYDDLSSSALAAGSIASLFRMSEFFQCPESMQVFLQHLSFLFHCMSYSNNMKAILDFHASILTQIESGSLSWSNSHEPTFTLQRLNFRAGLQEISAVSISSGSGSDDYKKKREEENKRKTEAERAICPEHRVGNCPKSVDHDGKKHVCFYCWYKRNMLNAVHPSNNCPLDPRKK